MRGAGRGGQGGGKGRQARRKAFDEWEDEAAMRSIGRISSTGEAQALSRSSTKELLLPSLPSCLSPGRSVLGPPTARAQLLRWDEGRRGKPGCLCMASEVSTNGSGPNRGLGRPRASASREPQETRPERRSLGAKAGGGGGRVLRTSLPSDGYAWEGKIALARIESALPFPPLRSPMTYHTVTRETAEDVTHGGWVKLRPAREKRPMKPVYSVERWRGAFGSLRNDNGNAGLWTLNTEDTEGTGGGGLPRTVLCDFCRP